MKDKEHITKTVRRKNGEGYKSIVLQQFLITHDFYTQIYNNDSVTFRNSRSRIPDARSRF